MLNTYIACFTFVTSLLYHCTDALGVQGLYLTPTQWHKLDNIGTIMGMITILIYLMDNIHFNSLGEPESRHETKLDRHLTYCGLGITMLMQTKDPWDITNTVIPILIFIVIYLVRIKRRLPRINRVMLVRGLSLMSIGVCFFVLGLDEDFDHFRLYHGMWHTTVSTSCFFMMQCIDKDRQHPQIHLVRLNKMERLSYWAVFRHVYTLQFLASKPIKSI